MKIRRRNNLLVEPPHSSTSDIAFILIIFFLICASVQPDSGRKQSLPKSEEQPEKKQQSKNPTVDLSHDSISLNGNGLKTMKHFESEIKRVLSAKKREVDKVVVLKSDGETPYERWIKVTSLIQKAGGMITLQLEEKQPTTVNLAP